jgi:hypothetical protein
MDAAAPYFIWFFMGVIVVVALIAAAAVKAMEKRRRLDMEAFAAADGFQFYPDGLVEAPSGFFESLLSGQQCPLLEQLDGFKPFDFGLDKQIYNLMVKVDEDTCIYVMDYKCETVNSNGKTTQRQKHYYTVVAMRHSLIWPYLHLSPEHFGHRVGKMFGMKDVSVESEEFNKKYFVSAEDEEAAYDILHPQAIEFLLRTLPRDWQTAGMFFVVHSDDRTPIMEIRRIIQDMKDFVSLVPNYVRQDRGFEPKWQGALDF